MGGDPEKGSPAERPLDQTARGALLQLAQRCEREDPSRELDFRIQRAVERTRAEIRQSKRRRSEMKIWFDTEFIEDGKTIDLISIGMVREDGMTYYAESSECALDRASSWVKDNVTPHLTGERKSREFIASEIKAFAGEKPEFWAYYADYDWVALCQLFGTMMDLPKGWPMYCRDVKQLCDECRNPTLPPQATTDEHHALKDAIWTKGAWGFLRHYEMVQSSSGVKNWPS